MGGTVNSETPSSLFLRSSGAVYILVKGIYCLRENTSCPSVERAEQLVTI